MVCLNQGRRGRPAGLRGGCLAGWRDWVGVGGSGGGVGVGGDVGGGDAEVLDEGSVVGAGAEGADADVGIVSGGVLAAVVGVGLLVGLPLVIDGAAFGAGDFFCDFADELFERGDGGGVE